MTDFFGQVLNMSLTASVIILFVLAARLMLKKAPKVYAYALWVVVLFRLLCPVSLTAPFSVLEVAAPQVEQSERVSYVSYTPVENVLKDSGSALSKEQSGPVSAPAPERVQEDAVPSVIEIVSWVWLAGMAVMLLNSAVTYVRLYRSLIGAMQWRGNVYLVDHITSPFVLGTLFPKIYLPSDTPVAERRYIIAHERHHIRRCDHIIKLMAYAALCIHWFNPLVWTAFLLAGKDMEMSCDEAVVKKLGEHIRADYSASLLRLATHKKIISGTPLAFGEGDTKGRVKNMIKWKKPKVWVSVLCVALCILIVAVCALNPEEGKTLKELTLQTGGNGPCGCAHDDFNYILPGGIAHWLEYPEGFSDEELDRILDGQENRSISVKYFAIGDEVFGGVQDHILPEGTDLTDPQSWVEYLNLWEWEDENLGCFGGSSVQADWELEFFTDVPPGTEIEPVQRKHYFFLSTYGHRVFDMWFDMTVADPAIVEEIISSAYISEGSGGRGKYKLDSPETLRLGGFQLTVPEGYGYIRTGDTKLEILIQRYWRENITLGGVDVYKTPDISFEAPEKMRDWVKALGVTWDETKDSIAVTDETPYGDLSLSVDDLHNGKTVVDQQHYFYIQGETVYDIWFDELEIDEKTEKKILDSITLWDFSDDANAETAQLENAQALAKCRGVLELVQSSEAYQITTERINGPEALNATSTFQELGYGENRLCFNRIPESGGESLFGTLIWDGVQYECDSREEWVENAQWEYYGPWLASWQWNDQKVSCVDIQEDGEGKLVMLRVDEPYPGREGYDPYYQANFRFDADGTFRFVRILASGMTEMESIVTLDPTAVAEKINAEYSRATGQPLPQGKAITTNAVQYQKDFVSDDGTVSFHIDAVLDPTELEKHGMTLEALQNTIEQEFRSTNVDSYGLNTTAMGYADAKCEINITEVKAGGEYLIAAGKAVPTLEVWGTRTYIFSNGDRLGEEQGPIKLLLINAEDGSVLLAFGRKN